MDFTLLSDYEKQEIKDYKEVYYISKSKNKSLFNENLNKLEMFSDDELRFVHDIGDSVKYRYEIIDNIGKGTYSNVVSCKDHKVNKSVALKMFRNFSGGRYNNYSKEVEILNYLKSKIKSNQEYFIPEILDNFKFRDHEFISTQLYDKNIYKDRIKIYNSNIDNKLIIIYDIFKALNFLRSGRPKIIHGDLKPENILFKTKELFNIVICDFGLSELLDRDYIEYKSLIQTRFYRAPEIIYKIPFNEKIDIWSAGCIIYEIIEDKVLFKCKKDRDLLVYYHLVLNKPDKDYINTHLNIINIYNNINNYDSYHIYRKPGNLSIVLDKFLAIDHTKANREDMIMYYLVKLIYNCLHYDPFNRIHSFNALKFMDENIFKE